MEVCASVERKQECSYEQIRSYVSYEQNRYVSYEQKQLSRYFKWKEQVWNDVYEMLAIV